MAAGRVCSIGFIGFARLPSVQRLRAQSKQKSEFWPNRIGLKRFRVVCNGHFTRARTLVTAGRKSSSDFKFPRFDPTSNLMCQLAGSLGVLRKFPEELVVPPDRLIELLIKDCQFNTMSHFFQFGSDEQFDAPFVGLWRFFRMPIKSSRSNFQDNFSLKTL